MKEEIARLLWLKYGGDTTLALADQILSLITERIKKSLLTDEEIDKNQCELEEKYEDAEITDAQWEVIRWRAVAQAQIDKILKEIEK